MLSWDGRFLMSIATILYPTISKMAAQDNMNGLKKSVEELSVVSTFVKIACASVVMGALVYSVIIYFKASLYTLASLIFYRKII